MFVIRTRFTWSSSPVDLAHKEYSIGKFILRQSSEKEEAYICNIPVTFEMDASTDLSLKYL